MARRSMLAACLCLAVVFAANAASAACGDHLVDPGEDCDGGLFDAGDCCSNTCTWVPAGTPCSDLFECLFSACDGAGVCEPVDTCEPASASTLRVKQGSYLEQNRVAWKWKSAGTIPVGNFGDPTTTTGITVCLRDVDSGFSYTVIAGGTCGGEPSWRAVGSGFVYDSKNCAYPQAGVRRITLRPDLGRITFKMRGNFVDTPPLTPPVRVRLVRDDSPLCWEATFPSLLVNEPNLLRGRIP